ncbi:MAG: hypothetical protein AAF518_05340 [Spirochaetota bacterium]
MQGMYHNFRVWLGILYLFLSLPLIHVSSIKAQDNRQIYTQVRTKKLKNAYCRYFIQYPHLKVRKKETVARGKRYAIYKVNKQLRVTLIRALKSYKSLCEYVKKDGLKNGLSIEIRFKVTYIDDTFVSVYYSGSDFIKNTPHPNYQYKGLNYSLETGKSVSFSSLFSKNSRYHRFVRRLAIASLLRQKIIHSKDEYQHSGKKHDFYIHKRKLHLINLYDIHVLQSVEAALPFKRLKRFLHKNYKAMLEYK